MRGPQDIREPMDASSEADEHVRHLFSAIRGVDEREASDHTGLPVRRLRPRIVRDHGPITDAEVSRHLRRRRALERRRSARLRAIVTSARTAGTLGVLSPVERPPIHLV